jgi:metallo-beta-lactamase class B
MDRFYDYNTPIILGEFVFHVMHTPGHTPGTSSFFFDDTDEMTGKTYKVGLHGGLGLNTMLDQYYSRAEDAFRERDAFRHQLEELLKIPVDISAVNHPLNIDMASLIPEDKNDYTNFVNPDVWKKQIMDKLSELDELEVMSVFKRI